MKWIFGVAFLTCMAAVAFSYCMTEDDCEEDECCVAYSSIDLESDGWCEPLGRRGRKCNVPDAKIDYYGGKYVHNCPCREGLECRPKGLRPNETDPAKIRAKLQCRRPPTITDNPGEVTEEHTKEYTKDYTEEHTKENTKEYTEEHTKENTREYTEEHTKENTREYTDEHTKENTAEYTDEYTENIR